MRWLFSSHEGDDKNREPLRTYTEGGKKITVYRPMWAEGAASLSKNMSDVFRLAMPITLSRKTDQKPKRK
jgi:hypothetical protein